MKISSRVEVTKAVKVLAVLSFLLFIWCWYTYNQQPGSDDKELEQTTAQSQDPKLTVDVYYECLCPDSRYFVIHELLPAAEKIGSLLTVRMWPYGKASTERTERGYSFQCQHGPAECLGNMYHACALENVEDQMTGLNVVKCMIDDNSRPEESARKCARQLGLDFESIQTCATGAEGEQLHYQAGVKTESLSPRVTFIPTIEVDGFQHSQKALLKDFKKEVCRIYTEKYLQPGQKVANCQ